MTQRRPEFLARQGYRRRRLMDAARALPILGAFLFLIPLLWSSDDGGAAATRVGTVYLFVIWALLIIAAALLARVLKKDDPDGDTPQEPQE